jgi:signal transduction histidine kinase
MSLSAMPAAVDLHDPLPGRQFKLFMLFWHVFYLGALLVTLVVVLRPTPNPVLWEWPQWSLILIVLAQAGLYLRTFAFYERWPYKSWWWAVYIVANVLLWLIEWRRDRAFEWVILPFAGQLFGALPPRVSLPVNAVLGLIYFGARGQWAGLSGFSSSQVLAFLAPVAGFSALGLFVHKLSITSSQRAELIMELEAARQQLELARQRDAELAALRERERLARDLHDSLGHALVTLTVQLEAAQRLYAVDPSRAGALLEDMKALARSSMEELRRSLANLRAPGLGSRSLAEALQEVLDGVRERGGLRVKAEVPPEVARLQPALAEVLWRTAQEALTNVERHARAQQTELRLTLEPGWVLLRVSDDGVGLPSGAESMPGHFGLRGIRERVEGLGGTLTCACAGDRGTLIEARLPMR